MKNLKSGKFLGLILLLAVAVIPFAAACSGSSGNALKIGYLADYSGQLANLGPAIERGVELAVEHINTAGGVNGQNVTYVTGDTALDATQATTEARRLINVENVHAIVGPLASSTTLAVAEGVIASARIPQVSPSATSPAITTANDNGFLFRSALSDAAQGVVLADNVVEIDNVTNIGVIYVNNPYGLGLSGIFEQNFNGTVTSASYEASATTYGSELTQIAAGGANALIIIGYNESTEIFAQAEQANLFTTYYFVDGNREAPFPSAVYNALEGFKGTAPTGAPTTASGTSWAAEYQLRYNEPAPSTPFVREAYDATIAIALAAEAAGSLDGTAIRDQLVNVATAGGRVVIANAASISGGLTAANNGMDINYEGVASTLEWNTAGDITSGFVAIWEFRNGVTQNIETVPFTVN